MPDRGRPLDAGKLRDLRVRHGWTQEDLAAKAEVSKRTIESAEAGKGVDLSTSARIAGAFNLSPDDLRARRRRPLGKPQREALDSFSRLIDAVREELVEFQRSVAAAARTHAGNPGAWDEAVRSEVGKSRERIDRRSSCGKLALGVRTAFTRWRPEEWNALFIEAQKRFAEYQALVIREATAPGTVSDEEVVDARRRCMSVLTERRDALIEVVAEPRPARQSDNGSGSQKRQRER